jgi:nitrogen fixation/metabolism regulation signal transduction histidine kinase
MNERMKNPAPAWTAREIKARDAEIERLSVAFRLMANQKLPHEMNSEDREFADWQHAYTACVLIARTAIAPTEDK